MSHIPWAVVKAGAFPAKRVPLITFLSRHPPFLLDKASAVMAIFQGLGLGFVVTHCLGPPVAGVWQKPTLRKTDIAKVLYLSMRSS